MTIDIDIRCTSIYDIYSACSVAQSCLNLCYLMGSSPLSPFSREFSRQEYWSGLPFPTPGDLPHPGIELMSSALASKFFTAGSLGKPSDSACNLAKPTQGPLFV